MTMTMTTATSTSTNTSTNTERGRTFPFDHIVVTNPDRSSAESAQKLLDQTLAKQLQVEYPHQQIKILSTYDPYGSRCGSGGGTLAAIERLSLDLSLSSSSISLLPSVLCLHAGGDSSRCPLCMILGKAWTSLPSTNPSYRNPTSWLIHQLVRLYYEQDQDVQHESEEGGGLHDRRRSTNIPSGSLWVAATDTLLSFFQDDRHNKTPDTDDVDDKNNDNDNDEDNDDHDYDYDPYTVIGIAVPAPIQTATNHGVYIMDRNQNQSVMSRSSSSSLSSVIQSPIDVWQKPSITQLLSLPGQSSFQIPTIAIVSSNKDHDTTNHDNNDQETSPPSSSSSSSSSPSSPPSSPPSNYYSWIDTGVVIFFPKAFETVLELSKGVLQLCTWSGLQASYQEYLERTTTANENATTTTTTTTKMTTEATTTTPTPTIMTLEQFAKQSALKIDLYTDILHHLSWTGRNNNPTKSVDHSNPSLSSSLTTTMIQNVLHQSLSKLQLKVLLVPHGVFLHLGTTRELMDFITQGCCSLDDDDDDRDNVVDGTIMDRSDDTTTTTAATTAAATTTAATTSTATVTTNPNPAARAVALALQMNPRSQSHGSITSSCCDNNDDHDDSDKITTTRIIESPQQNVTHCCIFPPSSQQRSSSSVGQSSFVEYCNFEGFVSVEIGNHCMVSGWRRIPVQSLIAHVTSDISETSAVERNIDKASETRTVRTDETSIIIPDGLCVQMMPLKGSSSSSTTTSALCEFVYIVLGTDDTIKSKPSTTEHCTIYGVNWGRIMNKSELKLLDIFSDDILAKGEESLWTANIHPVVSMDDESTCRDFSSLFDWIKMLRNEDVPEFQLKHDTSFQLWLSSRRVSLKDLHGLADAGTEWDYRIELERKILNIRMEETISRTVTLLRERCQNQPCDDFRWLTDIADRDLALMCVVKFVRTVTEVAVTELERERYDVSGRSLMLASTVLASCHEDMKMKEVERISVTADCMKLIGQLKLSSTHFTTIQSKFILMTNVLQLAEQCAGDPTDPKNYPSLSTWSFVLERLALCLIEITICHGFRRLLCRTLDDATTLKQIKFPRSEQPTQNRWILSKSPVRVDLAGGWSDTPPICYENGGSVTGMAVLVDDYFPLLCRCRITKGGRGIAIRSEIRDNLNGSLSSCQQVQIEVPIDLCDFRSPTSECALTKACLICLGFAFEEQLQSSLNLQPFINSFCGSCVNVGLQIVTTSLLGLGSGMGTSSILAACIISAISKCVGIGDLSYELLMNTVLMVEQLLSSGGGWQDQAHGCLHGIKTVRSPPKIPLVIHCEQLPVSHKQLASLERRLVLVFTGKTRLAKNILHQVLRRWSKQTNEIVRTVQGLVSTSEKLRASVFDGNWDEVANYMDQSFKLKCDMAGKEGTGALPAAVAIFVEELKCRGLIQGSMLCGAGGGGFLLMITKAGTDQRTIRDVFVADILPTDPQFDSFVFHNCTIARQGLSTSILEDGHSDECASLTSHSMSWHQLP